MKKVSVLVLALVASGFIAVGADEFHVGQAATVLPVDQAPPVYFTQTASAASVLVPDVTIIETITRYVEMPDVIVIETAVSPSRRALSARASVQSAMVW